MNNFEIAKLFWMEKSKDTFKLLHCLVILMVKVKWYLTKSTMIPLHRNSCSHSFWIYSLLDIFPCIQAQWCFPSQKCMPRYSCLCAAMAQRARAGWWSISTSLGDLMCFSVNSDLSITLYVYLILCKLLKVLIPDHFVTIALIRVLLMSSKEKLFPTGQENKINIWPG